MSKVIDTLVFEDDNTLGQLPRIIKGATAELYQVALEDLDVGEIVSPHCIVCNKDIEEDEVFLKYYKNAYEMLKVKFCDLFVKYDKLTIAELIETVKFDKLLRYINSITDIDVEKVIEDLLLRMGEDYSVFENKTIHLLDYLNSNEIKALLSDLTFELQNRHIGDYSGVMTKSEFESKAKEDIFIKLYTKEIAINSSKLPNNCIATRVNVDTLYTFDVTGTAKNICLSLKCIKDCLKELDDFASIHEILNEVNMKCLLNYSMNSEDTESVLDFVRVYLTHRALQLTEAQHGQFIKRICEV